MGVLGVAAATLLPWVIWKHFPCSTNVHFRWVRGFGEVEQTVPNFLQHLLAVATVITSRKCFESHLSVSFGFLSSFHVRACIKTVGGGDDATQSRAAAKDG